MVDKKPNPKNPVEKLSKKEFEDLVADALAEDAFKKIAGGDSE